MRAFFRIHPRPSFLFLLLTHGLLSTGHLHAQQNLPSSAEPPPTHRGQLVYEAQCAVCHNGGDARALTLPALQGMSADAISYALTNGVMAAQGQALSVQERAAVIEYLASTSANDDWLAGNLCSPSNSQVELSPAAIVPSGADQQFSRNFSAAQSGLQMADLPHLELAWALGLPGVSGLRSAPAVAGTTLFYPAGATQKVLALDSATGCVKWAYDAGATLRSSATLGVPQENSDIWPLIVTDEQARVHAINAETGEGLWLVSGEVDEGVATRLTAAPLLHEDRVIIAVSSSGVTTGANPLHECCHGRGALIMLDVRTGDTLWRYYTMPPAEYTGAINSAGARMRGPSGAPIWGSPTLDTARGFIYVTTGENTSLPATVTSNAIIALDFETGEQQWLFQAIANDVWNTGCSGAVPGPNCPDPTESILKDWDFGSAAVLVTLPDGSERLLAGQKSGHLWALDPDDGSVIWQQRIGEGGVLGGNHWGIAVDGESVFMPINDPHFASLTDDMINAGVYAFDIIDGEPLWEYRASPDCGNGRSERIASCHEKYGFSAMPLVIDGALVAANIDGRIFIFHGETGAILFEYDTAREFDTINGAQARGGSIDSHSVATGAGMLFVGSGYERFRQQTGNVLLAFRVKVD